MRCEIGGEYKTYREAKAVADACGLVVVKSLYGGYYVE